LNELLVSKYRRRAFMAGGLVTLFALFCLRFYIIPYFSGAEIPAIASILDSIVDKLFVALTASIIVTALVAWLTPPSNYAAVMEVVDAYKIQDTLEEAQRNTHEWWYRGAIGRHFRCATLPNLVSEAKKRVIVIKAVVLILDPTKGIEYFRLNRARLQLASKNKNWTVESIQRELYATIVSIYAVKAKEPSLDITIGLLSALGVFRIDLSSRVALVTTEGQKDPALRCDEGTLFYKSFREDLNLSLQQARILPNNVKGVLVEELDATVLKTLLGDLGFADNGLDVDALNDIINLVKGGENPYA